MTYSYTNKDKTYVNEDKALKSAERRSKELDKRAELLAELEVLRGPKSNYGTVQRWNYVVGGRRQWMAD